ncbi:Histone-lysine N-methyltransferase SETMAR, partial [Habropoda laboriosa]
VHQKLKAQQPALVNRKDPSDLSPTDFHFFRSLDNLLAEKPFRSILKLSFSQFLSLGDSNFYTREINTLMISWQKCLEHYGSYFKYKFQDDLMQEALLSHFASYIRLYPRFYQISGDSWTGVCAHVRFCIRNDRHP